MIRVITMIVLAVFFPMQLYAVDFGGFGTDTQIEYFVPRGSDKPKNEYVGPTLPEKASEQRDQKLAEKILEEPPKIVSAEKSGTNWWLWGGLAVVAGGVIALAAGGGGGGSKSSGVPSGGGGTTTTTVTGSW
ncbi:MAG: hypothetical protein WCD00_12655 [Desulfuromonadaceae bacterium]